MERSGPLARSTRAPRSVARAGWRTGGATLARLSLGWVLLMLLSACDPLFLLGLSGLAVAAAEDERPVLLAEDFSAFVPSDCLPDGSRFGQWTVGFAGYGCVRPVRIESSSLLLLRPAAAGRPEDTHAALVLGPSFEGAYTLGADFRTPVQLRAGSPANPWEVAWLVWDYTDDEHFYYFIPKPNGWELGKRDPAYPGGQRFLATGTEPTFDPASWHRVEVERLGTGEMVVHVDGAPIVRFTDRERPYSGGRIGFYTEDAEIHVRGVLLRGR